MQATNPVSIPGRGKEAWHSLLLCYLNRTRPPHFMLLKTTWCAFPLDPTLPPRPKPFNYLLQNPFKVTEEWALPLPPSLCPHPGALEPAKIYWALCAKPWRRWSGFSPTCLMTWCFFIPRTIFRSFCVNFSQLDLGSFGVLNSVFCSGYSGLQKCGKVMLFVLSATHSPALQIDASWVLGTRKPFLPQCTAQVFFRVYCTQRPWLVSPPFFKAHPSNKSAHLSPPSRQLRLPRAHPVMESGPIKLSKVYLKGHLRAVKTHPFWHQHARLAPQ